MVKIFFILVFIFSNALASEQQLYLGCSEVSITPNEPVALEGSFTLRISDGIHSPIQASVLAIGTGSKSLKDLILYHLGTLKPALCANFFSLFLF